MPFVTLPGVEGKFYMPARDPDGVQKHACANCFSCQRCSDDRCRVCLMAGDGPPRIGEIESQDSCSSRSPAKTASSPQAPKPKKAGPAP